MGQKEYAVIAATAQPIGLLDMGKSVWEGILKPTRVLKPRVAISATIPEPLKYPRFLELMAIQTATTICHSCPVRTVCSGLKLASRSALTEGSIQMQHAAKLEVDRVPAELRSSVPYLPCTKQSVMLVRFPMSRG